MATKWQGEPKRWRVRGKAKDGLVVTLGRHATEQAARADADKFVRDGYYRNVNIEAIELPPETPPEGA